jgi:hypothetical protein
MRDDLRDGRRRDEADVEAARRGRRGLRFEFVAGLMQVDLLAAEGERAASALEGPDVHVEHAAVELARRVDVAGGQDDVVDAVDGEHGVPRVVS